jgi:hypothetical protein
MMKWRVSMPPGRRGAGHIHRKEDAMNPTRFDPQLFSDPPRAYRPLQIVHGFDGMLRDRAKLAGEDGIEERLDKLAALGLGGVVANVSFQDYLVSPRQWEIYRHGLRAAAARGMELWWYDEKGYPSGTAGGLVTRAHPEYAALGLACYRLELTGPAEAVFPRPPSCRALVWAGAFQGDLREVRRDRLIDLSDRADAAGTLRWSAPAGAWTILYLAERVMYEGTHSAANVFELKQYVNLLDREATAEFIRVTYDAYLRETPPELWKKIRAVFTDEPSFMTTYHCELPERYRGKVPVVDQPIFKDRPPAVPWLRALPEEFRRLKGYDLRPLLYALFGSETEEACFVRQDFYEVVTRRYAEGFYGQIAEWCRAHAIKFSGHVLAEEWLGAHVEQHGSLFAVIRFMDLPGIDMLDSDPASLLNGYGFLAAKQVASVAHLTGAEEVHSECSDWIQRNGNVGATLPQRRGQGNLLYAMGINQVTAYWGWGDIGEEAYRAYNDYMGRLALLLRGGRHVCEVAVLYPIRAAWAAQVPHSPLTEANVEHGGLRDKIGRLAELGYARPIRDLLRHQIDLDISDEQAILEAEIEAGALCIAAERYRILVLPGADTLGAETAGKIAAFGRAGGKVFFVGEPPVRAESQAATEQLRRAIQELLAAGNGKVIEPGALVAAVRAAGADDFSLAAPDPDVLYTHRQAEGRDLYFVINNAAAPKRICPRLRVPGPYVLYRPLSGNIGPLPPSNEIPLAEYEGVFIVVQKGMGFSAGPVGLPA